MKAEEIKKQLAEIKSLIKRSDDIAYRQASKPLNFNQAADYLGFSHSYLYKLTSRKIIPCHRPTGKVLFFSKAELDDWVFSKEQKQTDDIEDDRGEDRQEDEPP